MLPRTPERERSIERPAKARRRDPRRDLRQPDALAARAGRAASEPAEHARLRRAAVHRVRRAARRPPVRRRPRDRLRASRNYHGSPVAVVGHQKGRDTKQKIFRNFGYARPEGYRKALRVMQLAREVPPADRRVHRHAGRLPGDRIRGARRRRSHRPEPARDGLLEVPIVVIVCGEGGSGGALGIAIGDRVLMQEFAVYSVIPPEGCAAILWRDAEPEGRGGRGAQDHRAGPAGARRHRRDRPGAGRRRAQRSRPRHGARRRRR